MCQDYKDEDLCDLATKQSSLVTDTATPTSKRKMNGKDMLKFTRAIKKVTKAHVGLGRRISCRKLGSSAKF